MKSRTFSAPASRQSGVVLAIALIMLVIITLLGVSAMQATGLEERMAGNARDRNLAFQAGEAALREGERLLQQAALPSFDGSGGLYPAPTPGTPPVWLDASGYLQSDAFWNANGVAYGGTMSGVAAQPSYIIEEIARLPAVGESIEAGLPIPDLAYYRVTTRAFGGTNTAVVILQSTYRRL